MNETLSFQFMAAQHCWEKRPVQQWQKLFHIVQGGLKLFQPGLSMMVGGAIHYCDSWVEEVL